MILKNKYLLLVVTILLFLFSNLFLGTYFDESEKIFNAFFLNQFTSELTYNNNYNVWFLIVPIISYLSKIIPNFYSLLYTLLLIYNFYILIDIIIIYLKLKNKPLIIITAILVFIFLSDIIFIVSNRKVIVLIVFNLLFVTYNYLRHNISSNYYKYNTIILLIWAIIIRFEISMIIMIIALIFLVFVKNKLLAKLYLKYFTFFLIAFLFYHILQNTFYSNQNYIEKSEHEFYDRGMKYYENETDSVSYYKTLAYSYFIVDSENLPTEYYKSLILNKSFILSKFNILYLKQYVLKIGQFTNDIINNRINKFGILFIFLLVVVFVNKHRIWLKFALFFIATMLFILLFQFFINFPAEIFTCIILFIILSLVIYIISLSRIFNLCCSLFVIIFICLLNISNLYNNICKYQKENKIIYNYYNKILETYSKQNKSVVFVNYVPKFENYPTRLFGSDNRELEYFYLSMSYHSYYDFYINHNKKFFTNITSFKSRLKDISDNKAIFISCHEMNDFIIKYSKIVCNMSITIEPINEKYTIKSELNTFYKPYKIYIKSPLNI